MKLVFATHNKGKLKEYRHIMRDLGWDVVSANDAGVSEEIIEDGTTFEENALKKARTVAELTQHWAISEDSGICIQALDNAPGIYSARWAGEHASDDQIITHTLKQLDGVPENKRAAEFVAVIALSSPDGTCWTFRGIIPGVIPIHARGTPRPNLPYDPIFIPEGMDKTFAELSDEEKNALSHRARAFEQFRQFLLTHPDLFTST